MRRLRCSFLVLGCILASTSLHAAGEGPSWLSSVRQRVAVALTSVRGAEPGVLTIGFTVGGTGKLVGLHAEGPPGTADRALAALRALGQVPAPPDRRPHAVTLRLNNR